MGFFDFLKKRVEQVEKTEKEKQQNMDPWEKYKVEKTINDSAYHANYDHFINKKCPGCGEKLKQPTQGTCPHCKEPVYSERHFHTKKRMLLTQQQAEQLEAEKNHFNDLKWALPLALEFGANDREIGSMIKSTKVDTKFAVLWVRANEVSIDYATRSEWLTYRNTRLTMADTLYRWGQKRRAVDFYLSVCFIDLNGPSDTTGFNAKEASLKRPVLQTVRKLAEELGLEEDELKKSYVSAGAAEKNRFMPLTPEATLNTFLQEYRKK
ncbi:MAG: hypothetical protein SCK29_00755 [Bacillota bacterium]|nr:hypothetical protein [Bacillota bacterium]MDW7682631.1 hypothetical protein [Bacillota bacterium]